MKNIGKLAVLGAVLTASASFAYADTVNLASYGQAANTITNPTETLSNTAMEYIGFNASSTTPATGVGLNVAYDLNPSTTWAAPVGTGAGYTSSPVAGVDSVWVGEASSAGPGYGNVNNVAPAPGYYTFTSDFTATGGAGYSGSIDVMADDTVEVLLNNVVIVPFGALGADQTCATPNGPPNTVPTCTQEDNVALNNITLLSGTNANVLTFVVQQAAEPNNSSLGIYSSGVDFDATLSSNVPEPSSLMLLGTGLVGAAGMFFRRRVTA